MDIITDLNIVSAAATKLHKELEHSKNKSVPAEHIMIYLLDKCSNDDTFSNRVLLDNKSLKDCFNYVYSEVKKKLNSVSGWVADEDVYKLSEDYFILDNVKIETKAPERKPDKPKIEVKEENEVEAVKEVKVNKEIKATKVVKVTKVVKESKTKLIIEDAALIQNAQVSLFDF